MVDTIDNYTVLIIVITGEIKIDIVCSQMGLHNFTSRCV